MGYMLSGSGADTPTHAHSDRESTMRFNGGAAWGGIIDVYPVRTTTGRLLIGCTTTTGREFCITIRRWISERRSGTIRPFESRRSVHSRYAHYRSGEDMAMERFLDRD
jgi:hypothetical protein